MRRAVKIEFIRGVHAVCCRVRRRMYATEYEGRWVEDANYSDESEGKTDFQGEILW